MHIDESHNLVHVAILHENKGETLLDANLAELRIRRVLPLTKEVKNALEDHVDPVSANETGIEWPLINERKWSFNLNNPFEIEPGERDSLHADFFIDKNEKIVQFYYYIANVKKEKKLGWTLTQYYQISLMEDQHLQTKGNVSDECKESIILDKRIS
jgi:hypothetical protein